jgi:hypothetical protein
LTDLIENLAAFLRPKGLEKLKRIGIERQPVVHLAPRSFHFLVALDDILETDSFAPKQSLVSLGQCNSQWAVAAVALDPKVRGKEIPFLFRCGINHSLEFFNAHRGRIAQP